MTLQHRQGLACALIGLTMLHFQDLFTPLLGVLVVTLGLAVLVLEGE